MVRQTKQREAIREVLAGAGRPLTPQEIFEMASAKAPRLGLRTVYRNIREMLAAHELLGLDYPGQPVRYTLPNPEERHCVHFLCRTCNCLYVLTDVETPDVELQLPRGYTLEGEELILYGRCPSCSGKASG